MGSYNNLLQIVMSNDLFWDLLFHGLFALPLVYLFWIKTSNWKIAIVPLVVTYAIDFDHLIDYWGYYGLRFNLSDFLRMEYFLGSGSGFVPFHAYEWVILLIPISIKRGWNSIVTAINLGVLMHLLVDIYFIGDFLFYSIIYRYFEGFRIFM